MAESDPSTALRNQIRDEAISQVAKWALAGFVALVITAFTGWWIYLEPKVKEYISEAAGGVPTGAILASATDCQKLPGKWEAFTEGTGRFLVGAGSDINPGYASWLPEGGSPTKLGQYKVMEPGGEERHLIKVAEAPQVIAKDRVDYGGNHDTGGIEKVEIKQQAASINILPPYVGVYFCKKK